MLAEATILARSIWDVSNKTWFLFRQNKPNKPFFLEPETRSVNSLSVRENYSVIEFYFLKKLWEGFQFRFVITWWATFKRDKKENWEFG